MHEIKIFLYFAEFADSESPSGVSHYFAFYIILV